MSRHLAPLFATLFVTSLFLTGLIVAVKPDSTPPARKVILPPNAVEVAPGLYYLGAALHEGTIVEGFAFIHYRENYAKGGRGGSASFCYGFLARGAKWKNVEPYLVNPWNTRGLDEAFVAANLAMDVGKWEAAAGVEIIGNGNATNETLEADFESPDDRNEAYFGDVAQNGAIAITVVWGVFGGPPSQRRLIEWDQVYDQVDFDWSANGEPNKMDFENIATHELGHSVGLSDLYDNKCLEQTMYGYADYGETKKRTLEAGDVNGVKELYG